MDISQLVVVSNENELKRNFCLVSVQFERSSDDISKHLFEWYGKRPETKDVDTQNSRPMMMVSSFLRGEGMSYGFLC